MTAPERPFSFDEFHNVIENVYITQVQNIDGQLRNVALQRPTKTRHKLTLRSRLHQSQPSYDRVNPTEETIKAIRN